MIILKKKKSKKENNMYGKICLPIIALWDFIKFTAVRFADFNLF